MALALALAVKLKLLYFEFCDIVQAGHVKIASMFVTIFHVGSFEDVLKRLVISRKKKKKKKGGKKGKEKKNRHLCPFSRTSPSFTTHCREI